jgi:hypothetical protein
MCFILRAKNRKKTRKKQQFSPSLEIHAKNSKLRRCGVAAPSEGSPCALTGVWAKHGFPEKKLAA